jgi:hypothetical protein
VDDEQVKQVGPNAMGIHHTTSTGAASLNKGRGAGQVEVRKDTHVLLLPPRLCARISYQIIPGGQGRPSSLRTTLKLRRACGLPHTRRGVGASAGTPVRYVTQDTDRKGRSKVGRDGGRVQSLFSCGAVSTVATMTPCKGSWQRADWPATVDRHTVYMCVLLMCLFVFCMQPHPSLTPRWLPGSPADGSWHPYGASG